RLELGGASPNPAALELRVRFGLASAAPARLELLDLSGRRCAASEVGSLGPGNHVLAMPAAHLAPGIYVLRLMQSGSERRARCAGLPRPRSRSRSERLPRSPRAGRRPARPFRPRSGSSAATPTPWC